MFKSKKGFTLVELSIIMAVTAIVIVMVCEFMVTYQHQSLKIMKSSDAISDINLFKETVNKWLDKNDDGVARFTVTDSTVTTTTNTNSLKFSSGGLTVNGGTTQKFEAITNCKFSKRDSIDNCIYCELTTKIEKTEKKIQLVFDTQCSTVREHS